MAKYTPPPAGSVAIYEQKLIRVEEELFSTEQGDMGTFHDYLAHQDGVLAEIEELKRKDPDSVDGCKLAFYGTYGVVYGDSSRLRLPMSTRARGITVQLVQAATLSFEIREGKDYEIFDEGSSLGVERR